MDEFLQLAIPGAVSGAIFAIMASGLVLTYQVSGIFNLAHGAVAFVTAYFFFQLNTGAGWPAWIAAVVSVVLFAPVVGLLLDRLLLRRLRDSPVYARVVGTIGLLIALPNLALWIVEQVNLRGGSLPTNESVFAPPGIVPVPAAVFRPLEGVALNANQIAVLIAAAFCAVALWLLIQHSRLGLQLRADVDRRDLAALRGVDTDRLSAVAWALSMGMAGLGGVLLAPLFQLSDNTFTLLVLGSVAAAVFARLRSLPLAFASGVALGVVQNLVAGYADDVLPSFVTGLTGFRTAVPFLLTLVALALLNRSRRHGREAGSAATEAPPPDAREGLSPLRRRLPWVVGMAGLLVFTAFTTEYWAGLEARSVAYGLIFLSFVVVTGLGGMISLAQATFVTAGGFTAGFLVNHQFGSSVAVIMDNGRLRFPLAVAAAVILCAALGAAVAYPIRRLGALELALATLALAFVGDLVVFQVDEIRNGSRGYSVDPPTIGGLDFGDSRLMTLLLLAVFGLVCVVIRNLQFSASGRAVLAGRSSDVAARTSGMSPAKARVAVFAVGAGIAGLGGAMFTLVNSPFNSASAPAIVGLIWLATVVTTGIRRPGGALLAGFAFAAFNDIFIKATSWSDVLTDATGSTRFQPILFGLAAVQLAKDPDGIMSYMTRRRTRKRQASAAGRTAMSVVDTGEGDGGPASVPGPASAAERRPRTGGVALAERPPEVAVDGAGLDLRGVVAGFGEVEVLHGVDLSVRAGSIVALFGANGAGKSTLCNVAAGLVAPTAGSVHLVGQDVTSTLAHERARAGLFVAPEARGVFPSLTVEENLQMWLQSASEIAQAYDAFPRLGERRSRAAGLLSGGEQQLLTLAPALVRPPKVLIADEPTLGLAPLAAEQVCQTLDQLRSSGVAVLLVEEKTGQVLRLADTVAVMRSGRLVWRGPAAEVDEDKLAAVYLGESQRPA